MKKLALFIFLTAYVSFGQLIPIVSSDYVGDSLLITYSNDLYLQSITGGSDLGNLSNDVLSVTGDFDGASNQFLKVETYQGTVTGATITAGNIDTVTVAGAVMAITWNTNVVSGTSGGMDTNDFADSGTAAWSSTGGVMSVAVIGGGGADTNAVAKTGDTMTGPLSIFVATNQALQIMSPFSTETNDILIGSGYVPSGYAETIRGNTIVGNNITNGAFWSVIMGYAASVGLDQYNAVSIGPWARAVGQGVAIGKSAKGDYVNGIAIGDSSQVLGTYGIAIGGGSVKARANSVAIGSGAYSYTYGVALGRSADAWFHGVALGDSANNNDESYGIAIGQYSESHYISVALGSGADADDYGLAIAYVSKAGKTNIAIGVSSKATNGVNQISLGSYVDNDVSDSCRIRGDLYLDGATNVMLRETFGTGAWTTLATGGGASGISTIPLNGSSALDWGVLNGTMSRLSSNGYSTIYGDHDAFRYTDSLPIYSASGGSVSTNYFGCWRDANATVSIIQQVSTDNGSTWGAVTNAIAATTTATVFGLDEITLNAGANLYRVAVATNATEGTLYIYQIDARGQW